MSSDVLRTEAGHWPAGVSGNPGGYSKEKRQAVARVADLAREYTPEAIQTLASIMRDESATRTTRIAAANALLDRAWGRPAQSIGVTVDDLDSVEPEQSPLEIARTIAFLLSRGVHEIEQPLHEREPARASHPVKASATVDG